jgi:hypothetical protein
MPLPFGQLGRRLRRRPICLALDYKKNRKEFREMKGILLSVLVTLSASSFASDIDSAKRMLGVLGMDTMLRQAQIAQEEASKERKAILMAQLRKSLEGLSNEKLEKIESLIDSMMNEANNSWNVEKAVEVYAKVLSQFSTDEEIKETIAFYEDPRSMRRFQMIMRASSELNNYIQGSYNIAVKEGLARTLPEIEKVILE